MEDQVLIQSAIDVAQEPAEYKINELNLLQLAIIGGGCAEVCPY